MKGGEKHNELKIRIKDKKINNDLEKRRLETISNIVIRICKEKLCGI